MAKIVLDGEQAVRAALGFHLGYSDWLEVDQQRVDRFAAAIESSFDGPEVDGLLLLALTNFFLPQIVEVRGFTMGVNYGLDGVRLPVPVPVGSSLRGGAELVAIDDVAGGIQTTMTITVEAAGGSQPVCVARALSRYLR